MTRIHYHTGVYSWGKTTAELAGELTLRDVTHLIDVRRLPNSCKKIAFRQREIQGSYLSSLDHLTYEWIENLGPPAKLLREAKSHRIDWLEYSKEFKSYMETGEFRESFDYLLDLLRQESNIICLLCQEPETKSGIFCHRMIIISEIASLMPIKFIYLSQKSVSIAQRSIISYFEGKW